jgi:hypothetical protein
MAMPSVFVLLQTSRDERGFRIAISAVTTVVVTSETVAAIPATVVSEVGRKCAHWVDKDLKLQPWLQFFRIQVGHQVSE